MGWLANQAEKADLKVGNMCVETLQASVPALNPRLEKVDCLESDKNGDVFTHWAVTITNQDNKNYYFSRCRNVWQLQMSPNGWPRTVRPVTQTNLGADIALIVQIAMENAEDNFF